MTSENKQNETQQTSLNPEGTAAPEPLKTYEQVNSGAPVISQAVIAERLARKKAESAVSEGEKKEEAAESDSAKKGPLAEQLRGSRARRDNDRRRQRNNDEPKKEEAAPVRRSAKVPLPNLRLKSEEEEAELAAMFADGKMDGLMEQSSAIASQEIYEETTRVKCRIVSIQKDFAFVDLGARDQGVIPLKQFTEDAPAQVGNVVDGVVNKYNKEDGLYEVSLPFAAAEAGDWSSISKGMIVDAKITGLNKGGLECEVGRLRAFMPLGQMNIFRVDNPEQFIGETWRCLITEANPFKRNLVISRRALIQQENAERRDKLMAELEVGQTRDGLVRKLIDAGAFVDLGGVDGFIPVSAMSWGRIKHPSDVMKEGDRISVTVTRIDTDRNRISLSFKDAAKDPWLTVADNFSEGAQARGKVTRIMPFGAFIEILPGVEGLVHISEIAYQRVENVSDALTVGDYVDVKILSLDTSKRKLSLSIKQLSEDPRKAQRAAAEAAKSEEEKQAEAERQAKIKAETDVWDEKIQQSRKALPKGGLKGGVGSKSEGAKFGLNW